VQFCMVVDHKTCLQILDETFFIYWKLQHDDSMKLLGYISQILCVQSHVPVEIMHRTGSLNIIIICSFILFCFFTCLFIVLVSLPI